MTKKQSTKKGGKKGRAEGSSIEARARAIIDDPDRYDEEVRHAISNMLRENSRDLADFVRRAEEGEEGYDLVNPLPYAAGEPKGGVRETPARRDARRLLERSEMLLRESDFNPITLGRAAELAAVIIRQGDDEQAHALLVLLDGILWAHYEEKKNHRLSVSVEGIAFEVARVAYSRTELFYDSVREFQQLDADTFREMNVLREERRGGGEA
jgi:hypothetical protein